MDQYTLFVLLSPFGCAINIMVAVYSWRHRTARAARPLIFTVSAVAAYLVFNTLELFTPTPQGTLFFAQVCYLCIGVLTLNWLAFALVFANRENWLASPYFRLLWIIPCVTAVLVFTNSYHHLIWKEFTFIPVTNGFLYMRVLTYGGWFWVFWLQAYMLILASAVLMVWASITSRKKFRMQSRLTVTATLLPLMVNLVYVLHLIPGLSKDYSPLGYAFSGILLAVSIFRYRMLDLTPFVRAILMDNMTDGMLTLDRLKHVVDFNPAAVRIFAATPLLALRMGAPFPWIDAYLQQFETGSGTDLLQTEMVLPQPVENAYYDLQIRRLRDPSRVLRDPSSAEVVGYLILMHDISEHKKLLQAVRKLAEEDTLTGVLNRGRFVELARQEIEQAHTRPLHFSILMIDIDYFKQVNDSLGHIGGDQLLQAFAQRLRVLLRSTDLIGRIGGDEFIVLLPGLAVENALLLSDRLCRQVAAEPMETKDYGAFPITISIGVAEYSRSSSGALEPVISVADQGLYQAKALGRNRACVLFPAA
jgi:diguanylate cyclase (GGDEF)-like protein